MLEQFGFVYCAVLVAEIVGDKLVYLTGVYAAEYRLSEIVKGLSLGIAVKMLVAVMIGMFVLGNLSPDTKLAVSVTGFVVAAVGILRKKESSRTHAGFFSPDLSIFLTLQLVEFLDPGMMLTATLATKYYPPIVWLGAVAAMATKASVAVGLTKFILAIPSVHGFLSRFSQKTLAWVGVIFVIMLGLASIYETMMD